MATTAKTAAPAKTATTATATTAKTASKTATAKTAKSKAAANKLRALEEMTPSERVAHEILQQFSDLAPSVDRIMQAELSETQRHRAITSFKTSLSVPGDPNRDPATPSPTAALPNR